MRLVANEVEVADEDVLTLTLAPDWAAVRAVGDRCRSALAGAGLGRDEAYALAMVAQELVENAVKYGAAGPGEVVRLRLRVDPEEVTVEVVNHLGVDDAHLRTFERTVEWIRGFQDPFEAYVERLKEISATPYADGRSGLGLARIAYEGRCALDFYAGPGDTLAVSAIHEREGGTP